MTFGAGLFAHMAAARAEHGGALSQAEWIEAADEFYRRHCAAHRRPCHPQTVDGDPDPLFSALAAAEGSNPKELTPTAARRIAVALAGIRKASPDLTPDEITKRAVRYRELFPRAVVTANALEGNWPKLNGFRFNAPTKLTVIAPKPQMTEDEARERAEAFRRLIEGAAP